MTDGDLVAQVRARPGLYGLDGTYYQTVTFLTGVDIGRSGDLLRGFTEWMAVRKNEATSFNWIALVFEEAVPGAGLRNWKQLEPHEDQKAVEGLFELLLEFVEMREDKEAFDRVYAQYQALNAPHGKAG
ncbi:hypothetical protein [Streptomyces pratensis]|jgi:hypothetical protein|uniref:hypothetical protein n=1 Tax=Streptomyces pratensis TaxID=1169025 RepID=UPI0036328831